MTELSDYRRLVEAPANRRYEERIAKIAADRDAWREAFNALWWREVGQPFIDRLSGHSPSTSAAPDDRAGRVGEGSASTEHPSSREPQ